MESKQVQYDNDNAQGFEEVQYDLSTVSGCDNSKS